MEFVPLIALGALVGKFLDFLKFLSAKDWNSAVTQVTAWVSGIGAVLLASQTSFAGEMEIAGRMLSDFTIADQVFFGLLATSVMSVAYDFKRAVDTSDSARTPSLIHDQSR